MARATWNGALLAESSDTKVVEGNYYFPPESINREYFADSAATSVCSWKGTASYYDVVVDGKTNPQAAWYYVSPNPEASEIAGYVAFFKGVEGQHSAGAINRKKSSVHGLMIQ